MKDYKRIEHMRNLNDSLIWERMKRCFDYGYEDGKADTPFTDTEEAEKKAYNRGLDDAWEAVRKIVDDMIDGGYSSHVLHEIFGTPTIQYIFKRNTASEAIAKIKEYEDKQKQDAEIKVGDEVKSDFGNRGVVITNEPDLNGVISVLFETCSHVQLYPKDKLTRTGRTFSQIAEVLKELRGAENDK